LLVETKYPKKIGKVLMINSSSWKTKGMLAALLLAPGFRTWAPSLQKWSLYENGKKFNPFTTDLIL